MSVGTEGYAHFDGERELDGHETSDAVRAAFERRPGMAGAPDE